MSKKKEPVVFPLRLEWRTPEELADNPANWRKHPDAQSKALAGLVGEVGWAGAALFNEQTGRLIDGHLRKKIPASLLVDGRMPVIIGNWTEEQERRILLTLDPLAGMAETDTAALQSLLADATSEDEAVKAMLQSLAVETVQVIDIPPPPESVQENAAELEKIRQQNVESTKQQRREGNANMATKNDTEIYLTVVFRDRAAREALLTRLGLPSDERYLLADSVSIAAVKALLPSGKQAAETKHSGACG